MSIDLPQRLNEAISSMPGWRPEEVTARPLPGGLMNSNWLITHAGAEFVLKLYGPGTEQFVDREVSHLASTHASELKISPRVVRFDKGLGFEMAEYLRGYRPSTNADYTRQDFLQSVIDLYRTFNSGPRLPVTKDVFAMTDEHIAQCRDVNAILPANISWLMFQYGRAKAAFMASGLDLAPCHNDPMPGNFLVTMSDDDRIADMKVIDFEFASNNERAYEVGVFLGEMFVDEATTLEMVERYYGTLRQELVARVWVARAVADVKWGFWAVQQRQLSKWDFDYQKYGIWKFGRAQTLFDDPRWNMWLRQI